MNSLELGGVDYSLRMVRAGGPNRIGFKDAACIPSVHCVANQAQGMFCLVMNL